MENNREIQVLKEAHATCVAIKEDLRSSNAIFDSITNVYEQASFLDIGQASAMGKSQLFLNVCAYQMSMISGAD